MSWSIGEVARISGVTSRTLRHYHEVGLLEPESVEFSGRRMYGQRELLRLREILLLRDMGMPLATIAEVLSGRGTERETALAEHLEWLRKERDRYDRLIETVERTIEEGMDMNPEEIFESWRENPFEEETRRRWGDDVAEESNQRLAKLTPDQIHRLRTGFDEVHRRIESLHDEGAAVSDPRTMEAIAEHHEIVSLTWSPDADQYEALGRLYVEDERFRQSIGRGNGPMVEFLAEGMAAFAASPRFSA